MIRLSTLIRPWLGVVACLAISPVLGADPEPGKIEAREPRAQIRAEILKGTNLGSSANDVLNYIRTNFKPKKGAFAPKLRNHPAIGPTAKESDKKGVQSIRLVLGHYFASPALLLLDIPMVAETTTTVQWAFDSRNKLIEVFVDKNTELGDNQGPGD